MIAVTAFLSFVLVATGMALRDPRRGIYFVMVVGALQDPVRKMTPGTPAILVLSSLPIWLAMGHQIWRGGWRSFRDSLPGLSLPIRLFMFALPLPVLITLGYGIAAWRLAALGLFGYLAPLAGIVAGFVYSRSSRDVERLLTFYCLLTSLALVGGLIEYLGLAPGWPAVGTEVLGFGWLRYGERGRAPISLIAGFFRSPDIMGWHAATDVMLALTVASHRRYERSRWLVAAAAFGIVCLLLSGRRKMLMMPVVWVSVVIAYALRAGRFARIVTLLVVGSMTAAAVYYASGEIGIEQGYYEYAGTVVSEGLNRVVGGTWDQVLVTLEQSGVFGSGIGVATQGSQHLALPLLQTWQESGPSRLMVELGVPGFAGAIILAAAVARACAWRLQQPSDAPNLALGLIAFAAANAASFMVSHQVYGDVVILTLSSFALGMGLSSSTWSFADEARPSRLRLLADPWRPRQATR